jgi:hypothetical protein
MPFKAMVYYSKGLAAIDSALFSFLDYAKDLSFRCGCLAGYVAGNPWH